MKNSTLIILMICATFASCTKEAVLPTTTNEAASANISEDLTSVASATFAASVPGTIYLTKGLNTIQSGNFSITGDPSYIVKFIFSTTGNPELSYFKFYVDGGQLPASISYSNGTITVAAKKALALQPGDHSYILQARTLSPSGKSFSITLNSANLVNAQRTAIDVFNLPAVGNTYIMN